MRRTWRSCRGQTRTPRMPPWTPDPGRHVGCSLRIVCLSIGAFSEGDALERRLITKALAALRFQNPAATAAALSRASSSPPIATTFNIHVACRHDLSRPAHRRRRGIDTYSHHERRNSSVNCNAWHGVSSIIIGLSMVDRPRRQANATTQCFSPEYTTLTWGKINLRGHGCLRHLNAGRRMKAEAPEPANRSAPSAGFRAS